MMKPTCIAATVLFATCVLLGAGGALAQTSAAPASADRGSEGPPAGTQPGAQPSEESQEALQGDEADHRAPVLQVTSVEVIRSTHGPVLDVIRVRGLTSTGGWEEGELVPLTRGTPSDGTLDLVFVAQPPGEATEATGFATIEAILPIEPGHPYKSIRVHGASNPVTLTTVPGYAEAAPAGEDCAKCIGKYFVAKGAPLPPGKTDSEVVKEEHLPSTSRIIKASDGIAKLDSDPNRLTLVVGDDGRIVTVVWD